MIKRRNLLLGSMSACLGASVLRHAKASQSGKPIRWVLGFAPGGGTDVLARALAVRVGSVLGVSVIVENKPGANGNIAAEHVARASPDGQTFLYNTSSLITSPALYPNPGYDPVADFVPITSVSNVPLLLVAHPSLPPDTIQEFVDYAKANPGRLTYASAGNGNVTHLSNLLFQQALGISAVHVPYKGGGPALSDLLGGHVDFYMDTSNTSVPLVQKNLLKGYASSGLHRLTLTNIPTLNESVIPDFNTGSWAGIVAPAKTPASVVETMNAAVTTALRDPSFSPVLAQQEAEARISSPTEYGEFLASEMKRWGAVIRANNVRAA